VFDKQASTLQHTHLPLSQMIGTSSSTFSEYAHSKILTHRFIQKLCCYIIILYCSQIIIIIFYIAFPSHYLSDNTLKNIDLGRARCGRWCGSKSNGSIRQHGEKIVERRHSLSSAPPCILVSLTDNVRPKPVFTTISNSLVGLCDAFDQFDDCRFHGM
jgi:hypothetical protein